MTEAFKENAYFDTNNDDCGEFIDGVSLAIHILHSKELNIKISVVVTAEESLALLGTLKDVIVDACQLARQSDGYIVPSEPVMRLEEGKYAHPVTTHKIHKDILPLWYKLQSPGQGESDQCDDVVGVVSSYGTVPRYMTITCFAENSLDTFLSSFRTPDNLMLVIGSSGNALSLHDNWCNDEDDTSIYDTYRMLEKRSQTRSRSFIHDIPYCDGGESEATTTAAPSVTSTASAHPSAGKAADIVNLRDPTALPLPPPSIGQVGHSLESLRVSSLPLDEGDGWSDVPPMRSSPLLDTPPPAVNGGLVLPTLNLLLAKGHEMPAPTLRVSLHQSRTATDMYGKSYTLYNLVVKQGGLEWKVDHRYSDFASLHLSLLNQDSSEGGFIPKENLPRLPSKKLIKSRSLLPQTVDKRRIKLGRYINSLVALEQAHSNRLVLSFLGMINTARFDHIKSQGTSRNTIHISKIRSEARWGDLILFKCSNTLSHLQRQVTRSEWDHVGLVVRSLGAGGALSVHSGGALDLLEATGEGVTCYPLTGRLKAYQYNNFTKYMCIRQLHNFERTAEAMKRLDDFVAQVVGKPYGFSASKIFPRKTTSASFLWGSRDNTDDFVDEIRRPSPGSTSSRSLTTATTFFGNVTNSNGKRPVLSPTGAAAADGVRGYFKEGGVNGAEAESKTFFCSELVAAALKTIDIIPKKLNASYFWPGSFARSDEIDTVLDRKKCNYGDELIIDCRVMEISRAVENFPVSKRRPQSVVTSPRPRATMLSPSVRLADLPLQGRQLVHSESLDEITMGRSLQTSQRQLVEAEEWEDMEPQQSAPTLRHANSSQARNKALDMSPNKLLTGSTESAAMLHQFSMDSETGGEISFPRETWERENSRNVMSKGLADLSSEDALQDECVDMGVLLGEATRLLEVADSEDN